MPFLRQRTQRFREHLQLRNLQARLAGFRDEAGAFDADEIAEIEQAENLHQLRPDLLRLHVNLDPPGRVPQIDEVALAHVAMRGDAAGGAQRRAFGEFIAQLADVPVGLGKPRRTGRAPRASSCSSFCRRSAISSFSSSMSGQRSLDARCGNEQAE